VSTVLTERGLGVLIDRGSIVWWPAMNHKLVVPYKNWRKWTARARVVKTIGKVRRVLITLSVGSCILTQKT
jgi:hypothetical protein